MLYSGLLRLDADLRPIPDLASDWDATPDGRTLTFTLRADLFWHDGVPLDAGDVIFTLDRLRALPPTTTALLADLRYISEATAPTADTVVLTLTSRFAPLFAALTVPILPRHLLAERDLAAVNFWELPVGSGPFRLAEARLGEQYRLERFERFHFGAPLLDTVTFSLVPEASVARTALAEGRLLLSELPWGAHEPLPEGVRDGSYPENGFYFLGFNLRTDRVFADPRLRQALSLTIDRPALVEEATNGRGIPINSTALPGSWADLTVSPAAGTDLDAARALLDQAGWILPEGSEVRQREGQPLTVSLYVRSDDERRLRAARAIATAGATIGMQILVESGDFASVILSRYAPPFAFDLLLGSWSNGAGDPDFADTAFYDPDDFPLFHSSQLYQGVADGRAIRNIVGYNSPVYDMHAEAARQLYNLNERSAAISNAQAQIAEELPYLLLWTDRMPLLLTERMMTLDGPVVLSSPNYYWNIERWYLQPR
jgi:peptide/nickel transport system substrate-binding protein